MQDDQMQYRPFLNVVAGELPIANKLFSIEEKALKIRQGLHNTRNHGLHAVDRIVNTNVEGERLADQGLDNNRDLLCAAAHCRRFGKIAGPY